MILVSGNHFQIVFYFIQSNLKNTKLYLSKRDRQCWLDVTRFLVIAKLTEVSDLTSTTSLISKRKTLTRLLKLLSNHLAVLMISFSSSLIFPKETLFLIISCRLVLIKCIPGHDKEEICVIEHFNENMISSCELIW